MSMRPDDKDIPSEIVVKIKGLPWDATKREICDFFYGVNIVNGENGIHLVKRATNNTKPRGKVYIELASNDDLQRAKRFHEKNLGTQYIEVFVSSFHKCRINGGNDIGRGPNKEDCYLVDAPALPVEQEPLPPDETLSLRVEALETLTNFLRINNENFKIRITALENAGRQCNCGAMTDVIAPQLH